MIDIVDITTDLQMFDSNVPKATNVVSVQLGALEYAQDFGVDLRFFLSEEFQFQNESFRSYLLQRLSESGIDVTSVVNLVEDLFTKYTFNISPQQAGGLVR